jgi:hypothetical protein
MKALIPDPEGSPVWHDAEQWYPKKFGWHIARRKDNSELQCYALVSPYGVVYVENSGKEVTYSSKEFFKEKYKYIIPDKELSITLIG